MEAPVIEDLRRRAGRFGLDIIMVNVWESVAAATEARNFCELYGVTGTVLVDETGEYAAALGIRGVPMNVFVDERGEAVEVGATTPDELKVAITRLLGRDDWYDE